MRKAAQGLLFSFPKKCRLVSESDFQSVFRQSKKISRPSLRVLYKPNQLPHARLGVLVSKRFVRKAVSRQLLKRLVRESFRHHQAQLAGFDVLVMPQKACDQQTKPIFRQEVDNAWRFIQKV